MLHCSQNESALLSYFSCYLRDPLKHKDITNSYAHNPSMQGCPNSVRCVSIDQRQLYSQTSYWQSPQTSFGRNLRYTLLISFPLVYPKHWNYLQRGTDSRLSSRSTPNLTILFTVILEYFLQLYLQTSCWQSPQTSLRRMLRYTLLINFPLVYLKHSGP